VLILYADNSRLLICLLVRDASLFGIPFKYNAELKKPKQK